jgi:hypothetical protein
VLGCRCSRLDAEVDGQKFVRCAQASAPTERTVSVGKLALRVEERVLTIDAPGPLTISAFSGPVARFAGEEREALAGAELAIMLGGLGESEEVALHNVRSLAAVGTPLLFIAGGNDRLAVVEAAFAALDDAARDRLWNATALRELRIGADRFVIVPGAALGRYAVDDQACGFTLGDLEEIQETARGRTAPRTWLLSWHAAAGYGVSDGFTHVDVGSPDLRGLALSVAAKGGIFAYPEEQAGRPVLEPFALVVPRLGALGSLANDGSRRPSGCARLRLGPEGLVHAP